MIIGLPKRLRHQDMQGSGEVLPMELGGERQGEAPRLDPEVANLMMERDMTNLGAIFDLGIARRQAAATEGIDVDALDARAIVGSMAEVAVASEKEAA